MFIIKEPSTLGSAWVLSRPNNERPVAISKGTTKNLKRHHIFGIDFLYQTYSKQFKGAILNEEDGMNMHLQVAAFLNVMFKSAVKKFLVLVVSPDDLVVNWHYHLKTHAGLKVQIVCSNTCPEDFDQEHGLALILAFSNIKLAEYLIDYDYFSIVIDKFDEVASKLIIKKLTGQFNIGLTERSFYVSPNQKLQWTMLNWSNPGCVGKLADFYEIDNDNFANFRDNYRHWWFRLTWDFCEFFKKLTCEEKQEYTRTLAKWAFEHHITNCPSVKTGRKVKKHRRIEMIGDSTENNEDEEKTKIVNQIDPMHNNGDSAEKNRDINEIVAPTASPVKNESSEDTIIYEPTNVSSLGRNPDYVDLPSMDENPILNSIIRNFETSPDSSPTHHNFTVTKCELDQPNCSKAFQDDDVLMSIIDNTNSAPTPPPLDHETQISLKKEELLSQIFNDEPYTSQRFVETQKDNGFFESLMEADNGIKLRRETGRKRCRNDDVDDILKETEVLLRE